MLACGTGVAVVPIRSITRTSVADKIVYLEQGAGPGPHAVTLADAITKAYKNAVEDKFGWLRKVTSPTLSNGNAHVDFEKKAENGAKNGAMNGKDTGLKHDADFGTTNESENGAQLGLKEESEGAAVNGRALRT